MRRSDALLGLFLVAVVAGMVFQFGVLLIIAGIEAGVVPWPDPEPLTCLARTGWYQTRLGTPARETLRIALWWCAHTT